MPTSSQRFASGAFLPRRGAYPQTVVVCLGLSLLGHVGVAFWFGVRPRNDAPVRVALVSDIAHIPYQPSNRAKPEPAGGPTKESALARHSRRSTQAKPLSPDSAANTADRERLAMDAMTDDQVVDFDDVLTNGGAGGASRSDASGSPDAKVGSATREGSPRGGLDAGLADDGAWNCPFPRGADDAGIHHAVVLLDVRIDAHGMLTHVAAVQDPGFGFGTAALRCAEQRRWRPAVDRSGAPAASTIRVRVRFER